MSLWIIAMALVLSACGAQGAKAPANATPSPTAKSATTLVTAEVAAQQSGSIAKRNLLLTVEITVYNHTNQPISLFGTCQQEAIIVSLAMKGTGEAQTQITGIPNCIIATGGDLQPAVPANGAQTYTRKFNLFGVSKDWQAGTYVLTVTIPAWRQHPESGLGGSATGRTIIALS